MFGTEVSVCSEMACVCHVEATEGVSQTPPAWLRPSHGPRLASYLFPPTALARPGCLFWIPIAMKCLCSNLSWQSVTIQGALCHFTLASWNLLLWVLISFLLRETNDFSPLDLCTRQVLTMESGRLQGARFSYMPIEICQCWFYTFLLVFNQYFVLAITAGP